MKKIIRSILSILVAFTFFSNYSISVYASSTEDTVNLQIITNNPNLREVITNDGTYITKVTFDKSKKLLYIEEKSIYARSNVTKTVCDLNIINGNINNNLLRSRVSGGTDSTEISVAGVGFLTAPSGIGGAVAIIVALGGTVETGYAYYQYHQSIDDADFYFRRV
ncbi:MAG: hypothetical protein ACK5LT_01335 [Lachnospirales bacterium]